MLLLIAKKWLLSSSTVELGIQEVDRLNLCITDIRNEYPSLYTHHTSAQLGYKVSDSHTSSP